MYNRNFHSSFGRPGMGMHGHGPMHSPHMGYHGPHFGGRYYRRPMISPMYNPNPFMFGYRRPYYRSYGFGGGLGIVIALLFLSFFLMI
ncbi:MAG: hypothetical protein Q4D71_14350 [Oscillospiraceae bacterium]|nr:hypothetical protein [Oscillospiraceae bacterium]